MGKAIAKKQCPACHSRGRDTTGDNLVVYEDGGTFCFACGYTERGGATPQTLLDIESDLFGIKAEVYAKYGVKLIVSEDTVRLAFPYNNIHGSPIKVKVRTVDLLNGKLKRDFSFKKLPSASQQVDKMVPLFGWNPKTVHNAKEVYVFEGERDMLTYESIKGCPEGTVFLAIPGVSNAQAAANVLSEAKRVHLVFDDDEAGQNAVKAFLTVNPGALVNVTPLNKDVCDALARNPELELQFSVSDGCAKNLKELLVEFLNGSSIEPLIADLPEPFSNVWLPRRGSLNFVCGKTGSGKSFFIDWLIIKAISQKRHVLLHSLEMLPGECVYRLMFQLTGNRNITPADVEASEFMQQWLAAFDKYLHINCVEATPDTIKGQIKANFGEIDIVIVDTLSLFASTLEWDKLIATAYALKGIALSHRVMVVAVSQMSAKGVKRADVGTDNLFASSGIAQAADYVQYMDANPDGSSFFKVLKPDRLKGVRYTCNVAFDFEAHTYYEVEEMVDNETQTEEIPF